MSLPPADSDYPRIFEYAEALQHPGHCFRDPELKACTTENDARGDPLPRTGGNAAVFKLINGTNAIAVKVFKQGHDERERRYRILSEYLSVLRLKHLVGFRYQQEGIRVNRRWYPILIMDWVEGPRLTEHVSERVRQRDPKSLLHLSERWEGLLHHLEDNRIAHGDLQHGNVLVSRQDLVLVDYDGMCVPDLVGHEAWECGLPGYQHPEREGQRLSLRLDDFSAWLIWIALRALAADLQLWARHVEATENENLLFTDRDISRPDQSTLWADLLRSPDPEVVQRAMILRASISKPFTEIPVFSLSPWADLCLARDARDWPAMVQRAEEGEQRGRALPADLASSVEEARRRVASRQKLEKALAGRDPESIVHAYEPGLVDDWLPAPLLEEAKKAQPRLAALQKLQSALVHQDGPLLVELWERYRGLLAGAPAAETIAAQAEQWRRRTESDRAWADLRAALAAPRTPARTIAEAWQRLQALGERPEAEAVRAEAERAVVRADCLDELRQVPVAVGEQIDRRFLAAWREELDDWWEAEPFRYRLQAVRTRVALLDELDQAIGQQPDEKVIELAGRLPATYVHDEPRGRQLGDCHERIRLRCELNDALTASPLLDIPLAQAWNAFHAKGLSLHDPAHIERCELAVRRRAALSALRESPGDLPLEQQDRELLLCWRENDLDHCLDVQPEESRKFEEARLRSDRWFALLEALRRSDHETIVRLASDPVLAGYVGAPRRKEEFAGILKKSKRIAALLDLLRSSLPPSALGAVDLSCIAEEKARFEPYRQRLQSILQDELSQTLLSGAGELEALPAADGAWKAAIRWTGWSWRRLGLGERMCRVALSGEGFFDHPPDDAVLVTENGYGKRGAAVLPVLGAPAEVYVTVWPVLRIAALELEDYGPPLHLGPISRPESILETRKPAAVRTQRGKGRLVPHLALATVVLVSLGLRGWSEISSSRNLLDKPQPPDEPAAVIGKANPALLDNAEQAQVALRTGSAGNAPFKDKGEKEKLAGVLRAQESLRDEARRFIAAYLEGCDDKGQFATNPNDFASEGLGKQLSEHQSKIAAVFMNFPLTALVDRLDDWLKAAEGKPDHELLPRFSDDDVRQAHGARAAINGLLSDPTVNSRVRAALAPLTKWFTFCSIVEDLHKVLDGAKQARLEGEMKALDGVSSLRGDWTAGRKLAPRVARQHGGVPEELNPDPWVILFNEPTRTVTVKRTPVLVWLKKENGDKVERVPLAPYDEFTILNDQARKQMLADLKKRRNLNYDPAIDSFDQNSDGGTYQHIEPTPWSKAARVYNADCKVLFAQWTQPALDALEQTCRAHHGVKGEGSMDNICRAVVALNTLMKRFPKLLNEPRARSVPAAPAG
jgi:predicted Ser/Thr protein kinase